MLKPQDCLILIKLIANIDLPRTQRQLAQTLCISLSEINAGIKRLVTARLLNKNKDGVLLPNLVSAEEFLISGLRYAFPARLGKYTFGTPTAVAAPIFNGQISFDPSLSPVWPDPHGPQKGVALKPLYPSVLRALREHPDDIFYSILALIDAIRVGRDREREMAINILRRLLHEQERG